VGLWTAKQDLAGIAAGQDFKKHIPEMKLDEYTDASNYATQKLDVAVERARVLFRWHH
jgi:hypothetical protein